MIDESPTVELPSDVFNAIQSTEPVRAYTHNLYKYPARFSPLFPRSIIQHFTQPGEVVIDPFMGSGTTLVEAMVAGRNAIGIDINPLAQFVAEVKTSVLTGEEKEAVVNWWVEAEPRINCHRKSSRHKWWYEQGYQKDLPWPIRKLTEQILHEVNRLESEKLRKIVRCAVLSTGKWALDCTKEFPSAAQFRRKFSDTLHEFFDAFDELAHASGVQVGEEQATVICLNEDAKDLNPARWSDKIPNKPSVVITSPPYPGVHVLYHRWQIKGRKETPAPYWIAGTPDGNGESFYTMGGRSKSGIERYFESLEDIYRNLHCLLEEDALVFQLVAFSDIDHQLPRFLRSLRHAGFCEVEVEVDIESDQDRIWRRVPLRRWYASLQGKTSSSREYLLVHQKVG